MKKSDALKQQRAAKIEEWDGLVKLAETEKREFTAEEEATITAIRAELAKFDKSIEAAIDLEQRQAAAAAGGTGAVSVKDKEEEEKAKVFERVSIVKAIRNATPGSSEKLDGAEKEMHEIGMLESRNAKVDIDAKTSLCIPLSYLARATAQTVSEDSGDYGGALVQNQAPRMVAPLRPTLAFEALGATFMTGLSGGDIPLIVDNDFAMTFLAETAAITPQKKTYAGPSLSPKRAGGAVDISNRLIMQSSVDVENMVKNGLTNGFKQLLHGAIINGGGGTAPTGLLSVVGVNAAAATAATAATWAQIVELQGLIEEDNATDKSLGYLLHPKLKAKLKTIQKDAGSGRFLLEGDSIDGVKYISTSLVPVLTPVATDTYPIIYGDWSQMVIGQWGSINVTVNPYSADLSNSVRLVLNTYADMQIANPKAFAKNGFLTA